MPVSVLLAVPGWTEILVVLGAILLLFGSTKLPKLARSLGASMTEFKKGLRGGVDDEPPKKKVEGGDPGDESSGSTSDEGV